MNGITLKNIWMIQLNTSSTQHHTKEKARCKLKLAARKQRKLRTTGDKVQQCDSEKVLIISLLKKRQYQMIVQSSELPKYTPDHH